MGKYDLGPVVGPQGPQGATGPQGAAGPQGLPGPNEITGSTATSLNGVLAGNGSTVGATEWMGDYLCTYMLIREGVSVLENVSAITPIVPKWLLEGVGKLRKKIDKQEGDKLKDVEDEPEGKK